MFYRSIKLPQQKTEAFRDKNKRLVQPCGERNLILVNYTGSEKSLHGCLVAEIGFHAKTRNYRGKNWNEGRYNEKKIVVLRNLKQFFAEIRQALI